jgi:hypothetical protein
VVWNPNDKEAGDDDEVNDLQTWCLFDRQPHSIDEIYEAFSKFA